MLTETLTLAEAFEAHRMELDPLGSVKCHACDDWTEGTIWDHHAAIASAHIRSEVGRKFQDWADVNEIAAPPLDWAWFGEIVRWAAPDSYEAT